MKLKNFHADKLLEVIMKIENDKCLTKKIALKFMNTKDALIPIQKNYIKIRDELIMKYGEKTERGFEISFANPKFIEFNKEIEPIANDIVEVSLSLFSLDDLPDDLTITTNDLQLLKYILKEIEEINTPKEILPTDSPEVQAEKA